MSLMNTIYLPSPPYNIEREVQNNVNISNLSDNSCELEKQIIATYFIQKYPEKRANNFTIKIDVVAGKGIIPRTISRE